MRNDLISLIFSNSDGSEVTMPASQLLEISSSLQELLTTIGGSVSPPVYFTLQVAAADRGSFRLSFKWLARSESSGGNGKKVETASKIAQTAFHVISTVSLFLVMTGNASWNKDREPDKKEIEEQVKEVNSIDRRGIAFDAAGKLVSSVIAVNADTVILEVPAMPPVTIIGADTKNKALLASRPQQSFDYELFNGYQGTGYPREISLKLEPWSRMRALVKGEERILRTGWFTHKDKTYKVIVIWNSKKELDENTLGDMPPFTVMARISNSIEEVEPIDPVRGAFRNADGYVLVEGVKTFE